MKVLVSAYACEPGKGSEPGAGWRWAGAAAQEHEVWLLTRSNNRSAIDDAIAEDPRLAQRIHPVYLDLPPWIRRWKRGPRGVHLYYALWQQSARRTARTPEEAQAALAGFVAAVGLQSGLLAIDTIRSSGLSLFMIGVVVTLVPLILSMLFGRYVLRYDNTAVFAGALSGARSANPAFGGVLDKAGNSVPTVPFAITYALANVFLTLLGPLVVAFA